MGRDDEKIGSNIVFQTENSKLYAEAILSDYGIGFIGEICTGIYLMWLINCLKCMTMFHDEEMVITI